MRKTYLILIWLAALFLLPVKVVFAQNKGVKLWQNRAQSKREDFHKKLLALVKRNPGNAECIAAVRKTINLPETKGLVYFPLPDDKAKELPKTLPVAEKWKAELRVIRRDQARSLYMISGQAKRAKYGSYAATLVSESLRVDPDYPPARAYMGWVEQDGKWVTRFAQARLRGGYVWHDQFGWILKTRLPRYLKGERFYRNKWITKAEEEKQRRNFKNAWEIRTSHFLVKTNVSLEQGASIARKLEDFYRFFAQVFAGFFHSPEQLAANGGRRRVGRKPHVVHYYATRAEYNASLIKRMPQVGITTGMYMPGDRISYFFHDPTNAHLGTVFHEATHQLLYETRPEPRRIGFNGHFWIIEGIACYMESYRVNRDGSATVGDPAYIRFSVARYRWMREKYFVRMIDFAPMGTTKFQSHKNIARNYSQAAGLAHYFMHGEGGRLRPILIKHLSQLYNEAPRKGRIVKPLPELLGVEYADIDAAYKKYLENQARQVKPSR